MTYANTHCLMTFGGAIANTEQWQCGLRWALAGTGETPAGDYPDHTIDNVGMADILADLRAWQKHEALYWVDDVSLDWVKLAVINRDGTYAREPRVHSSTTKSVGAAYNRNWPQVAMAVTLHTGATFGTARAGRIYLPAPGLFRGPQELNLPALVATNIATRTASMLRDVRGELSVGGNAVDLFVHSKKGTGRTRRVTQVRLGRVLDTQRRRRNAALELPVLVPLDA